ncbi:hypothetical protein C0991_004285 [Blastosporella zonata]|nr:hypothetical protein C0991_004285 [Blastosporella zonata]
MSTIKNYLELRNTGGTIEKVGDDLVQSIRSAHAEIDLTRLEKELRAETNKEGSYTKDDLEVADVVLLVIKEQEDEKDVAPKAEANGGPK